MQYIVQDLIVVLPSERWSATQHYVHHDSHGPVVTLCGIASLQYLWRYVIGCPIWCCHQLVLGHLLCQTEVYQLYVRVVVVLIQQKVLRFDVPIPKKLFNLSPLQRYECQSIRLGQVPRSRDLTSSITHFAVLDNFNVYLPMADAGLMKVAESIESLFHDHSCLSLSKVLLLSDVVEQFSSLAYSKHQKMRIRTKCHSSAINLLTDSSYRDGQASSLHQYSNWIIRD